MYWIGPALEKFPVQQWLLRGDHQNPIYTNFNRDTEVPRTSFPSKKIYVLHLSPGLILKWEEHQRLMCGTFNHNQHFQATAGYLDGNVKYLIYIRMSSYTETTNRARVQPFQCTKCSICFYTKDGVDLGQAIQDITIDGQVLDISPSYTNFTTEVF